MSPANGSFAYASGTILSLAADATDLDGTVTNVQFFAGANQIAEVSTSPWIASWSSALSGSYFLAMLCQPLPL
jgi:Bacterial Ig domain